jgi:hypothetical protein
MDDWLIFQYHLIRAQPGSRALREPFGATDQPGSRAAKGGRRRVARPRRWLFLGQVRRETFQANPEGHYPETRRRAVLGEASDPMLPRKASSELVRCPYPKPTQVGT